MKPMYYMTKRNLLTTIGMLAVVSAFAQKEYPSRAPMTPAMSEYWTPQPPIVTPGKAPAEAIGAPSDAIILFDGKDLSQWENSKGQAAGWTVHDGVFTVKKGTGDIRTKQKFNDFQLHLEWCIRKVLKVQIRQEVIAEYFYKVSMRYRSWTTTRTKRMSMVRPEVSISRLLLWSMP